ncbi:MAG: ABC transporter permease [Deltaproteobacteria bacterium]|nr:MAG: ABC transporter permease [Deltaproteobacteria bacterium]
MTSQTESPVADLESAVDAPVAADARQEDPSYGEIVWGQFRKRRLAMACLYGLVGLFLLAVYAPVLASNKPFIWQPAGEPVQFPWFISLFDRTFFENQVDLFFNTLLVFGTIIAIPVAVVFVRTRNRLRRPRRAARSRALVAGIGAFLLCFAAVQAFPVQKQKEVFPRIQAQLEAAGTEVRAVYPPLPYSFRDGDIDQIGQPISRAHLLGTDNAGRDVLTRLLFGTRISLTIGVFAVALYITLGTIIGSIAGYYGGRVDALIQRIIEVVICVPSLFLILTVAAFIENRSIFHIMVIIAAVAWTSPARLIRAEFLRLRNLDFVSAARAVGYRERTIIFKEILPNAIAPVLVAATFGVARAILIESTMSFLGLGDITVPSWGQILNTGRTTSDWVLILAPGFAIFVTVSLLNLVGEGFRDALDPKLRK